MPITLSHLAEDIFARMANRKRFEIAESLGLSKMLDPEHVRKTELFALPECKLSPHGGFSFDGTSRIDVALWIQPNLAVGVELKLGTTRLNKARFDDEFLKPCHTSHSGKRLAGNMMTILDRRFGGYAPEDGLAVNFFDSSIPLSRTWILVTHQTTLDRWLARMAPSFSHHISCQSIQKAVFTFGGKAPFNALVSELLDIDYHDAWIATAEQANTGEERAVGA